MQEKENSESFFSERNKRRASTQEKYVTRKFVEKEESKQNMMLRENIENYRTKLNEYKEARDTNRKLLGEKETKPINEDLSSDS